MKKNFIQTSRTYDQGGIIFFSKNNEERRTNNNDVVLAIFQYNRRNFIIPLQHKTTAHENHSNMLITHRRDQTKNANIVKCIEKSTCFWAEFKLETFECEMTQSA